MVDFEEAEILRRLSHEKETSNVNVSGVHTRKIQEAKLVAWPSPR